MTETPKLKVGDEGYTGYLVYAKRGTGGQMMAEYIEREAAAKLIKSVYIEDLIAEWYEAEFDNVYVISKKELLDIPAADVRPVVRGKWEDVEVTYVADKTTLPFERISSMRCNRCNRYHTEIYYYGNPIEMAHYCPNCGADMKEES